MPKMRQVCGETERIVRSELSASVSGKTLIDYLSHRFTYHTSEEWLHAISCGEILLDGNITAPGPVLMPGRVLEYHPVFLKEPDCDLRYEVLYEDERVLAVAKSGNLASHPAGPFFKHTLWYQLRLHYGDVNPINRLDRETSGVMLFARDRTTAALLGKQLAFMQKCYYGLVFGTFTQAIDANGYLEPDSGSVVRKKRRFCFGPVPETHCGNVQSCRTLLEPVATVNGISLVRALPRSGRLHQIRATLFSLGFPLLGDKLYGPDDRIYLKLRAENITEEDRQKLVLPRQALHAASLRLRLPWEDDERIFFAPLPQDMQLPGFPCVFEG